MRCNSFPLKLIYLVEDRYQNYVALYKGDYSLLRNKKNIFKYQSKPEIIRNNVKKKTEPSSGKNLIRGSLVSIIVIH
ncbi:MAG TPA: hypothetical protein DCK78_10340 [Paenibacillus lactis]|nr:hypothetical protein [Paenibacillus lactis]